MIIKRHKNTKRKKLCQNITSIFVAELQTLAITVKQGKVCYELRGSNKCVTTTYLPRPHETMRQKNKKGEGID